MKPTNKKAIIYDKEDNFIGKRRVYEEEGTTDSFVFINGWCESVRYLISRRGYIIGIEVAEDD